MNADLSRLLTTRWLGRAWQDLDECVSTNDEAAAWAKAAAPHGAVVVARTQSRGRGRLGRSWYSPPDANLYFSVLLRPSLRPAELPPITLATAVALAETVRQFGFAVELKWPNDLLIDGRKIAGILTEMATQRERVEHLVVGIGVNLQGEFPSELSAIAGSLAQFGPPVERLPFIATLCNHLEKWYDIFFSDGAAAITAAWCRFASFFGRRIAVSLNPYQRQSGVALSLDSDGALLLQVDSGEVMRVIAGEIVDA